MIPFYKRLKRNLAVSATTVEKPPKRTFLQRLFRGGLDRPLINLWIEERECGYGQRITDTKLKLGRYTVLRWEIIKTDMDQFERGE